MPDAVQFSVTKKEDGSFKIVVQDERQIIRTHEIHGPSMLTDIIEDELEQLRSK